MSYGRPHEDVIWTLRRIYPAGLRIKLIYMNDVQAPPIGTLGTVQGVDDFGNIEVNWDNGSRLSVIFGEDVIMNAD